MRAKFRLRRRPRSARSAWQTPTDEHDDGLAWSRRAQVSESRTQVAAQDREGPSGRSASWKTAELRHPHSSTMLHVWNAPEARRHNFTATKLAPDRWTSVQRLGRKGRQRSRRTYPIHERFARLTVVPLRRMVPSARENSQRAVIFHRPAP